jgi:hypothetical protein
MTGKDLVQDTFFTDLLNTTPYFKAGIGGAAGSGKSFTSALIAIGIYKRIKSEKPIVIYDTEKSAKFLKPLFDRENIPILLKQSRSIRDLSDTMDWCDAGNADILVIDSITHVWELFLKNYKAGKKYRKDMLEFQDWGKIKPLWKEQYSDRLVMSRCHIIFTGREGYTYEWEVIDGKKELVTTGVKMNVEKETPYEPDVSIRMERFEKILGEKKEIWREATIMKDRADIIDGKVFKNPTYENFAPVIDILLSDVKEPTNAPESDDMPLFAQAEDNSEGRRESKIWLERNTTLVNGVADNKTTDGKKMNPAIWSYGYEGETSETAISGMTLEQHMHAHTKIEKLVKLIKDILRGEGVCYPVKKAVESARLKHAENLNLAEADIEKLEAYLAHMVKKVEGAKAEADKYMTKEDCDIINKALNEKTGVSKDLDQRAVNLMVKYEAHKGSKNCPLRDDALKIRGELAKLDAKK